MNNKWKLFFLLFVAGLILTGCLSAPTETFDNQVETLVASTLAMHTPDLPQPTLTSLPTLTSEPLTSESFGEVYVYTTVQNVNLRTNPGMLFTVSRVMPQDTRLRLLGQTPGGEWLQVMNEEGIEGWVSLNVVLMAYDGPPPPIVEPTNVYLVTGSVFTKAGTPVSGVGFAIVQGDRRTDASTDENGQFHAYLPMTLSGVWQVGYVSIACTSNTMDVNCNCINSICGSPDPVSMLVELPQVVELNFIWK